MALRVFHSFEFGGIRSIILLSYNIFTNDEFELPKTYDSFTTRNKTVMKELTRFFPRFSSFTIHQFDLFAQLLSAFALIFPFRCV